MESKYNPKEQEERIYKLWEKWGVFSPEKSQEVRKNAELQTLNETFCVLMPPPNANAPLHCGHATYAIQDIFTRIKRMQGYKALYIPGTDHAGFETQVVYERKLKKEGKSRFDFDRDTLFQNILDFVKENSQIAINQLRRLGMSADWSRTTFMLDDHVVDTVYNTFEKMHKEGLIYRDTYMVNYSTFHGTTFSNLETTHKETKTPLYYVRYKLKDSDEHVVVATVRPETIYADVALAINPKDPKNAHYKGKIAINPLTGRELPIIEDQRVEPDFGTGILKITPGHAFIDYEIGKEHELPIIVVIDLDGRMKSNAPEVTGLYPKQARIKVAELLKERGALAEVDDTYISNLLVDYKDKQPIEPLPLPNWFIKMESLANEATKAIQEDKVKFVLPRWKKEILRWLENIHDWPISRQIVFGIKIPVWYNVEQNPSMHVSFIDKTGEIHEGAIKELLQKFTLREIKDGLQKIIAPLGSKYIVARESPGEMYIQETDTFDTWFSSGQWPLTTLHYPNHKDFKEFFPTSMLDTMWDILFFWVARMIMFSLYLTGEVPFKTVYIHGAITDQNGQKMSKSKGNVINPMDFVEKYGADALRMGLIVGGNTLAKETALSEDKVRGYRNFANKLWNMARFIQLIKDGEVKGNGILTETEADQKIKEMQEATKLMVQEVNDLIAKYRLSEAGNALYHYMWHTLADEYIEVLKNMAGDSKERGLQELETSFYTGIKLLHPFMPFVTEAIWQQTQGKGSIPLALQEWPTA